ncbi:hypothetical protein [Actinoallomurus soli]|uniref:hypothetical protein n=1 Tax=Actinoallomurus soli TaxID=2952535 RepID=UPI00209225A7|nr:hypothetical protein [Actinoallomurus soli]MCO5968420.1 hypothetical protein [Actinoallomurus soli]
MTVPRSLTTVVPAGANDRGRCSSVAAPPDVPRQTSTPYWRSLTRAAMVGGEDGTVSQRRGSPPPRPAPREGRRPPPR